MMKGAVRVGVLAGCALGVCGPSAAQTTSPAPNAATGDNSAQALEEADRTPEPAEKDIVVTARKSGETLLKAPATITILSQGEIQRNNVVNANQLTGIVPGLIQSNGSGGGGATTFRGLGSNGSTQSVESSVAAYMDGVYLGHNRDYVTPLYDVDHVELIKGTQSTLLGKNTSIGAVSIVTRRPTSQQTVELSYTHSFVLDGDRITGAVNLPVSDDLDARAAFLYSNEQGYFRNTFTGEQAMHLRDISGRVSLQYRFGDGSVYLSYQHDDRNSRGQNFTVLSDNGGVLTRRAAQIGQANFRFGVDTYEDDASAVLAGTPAGPGAYDTQKTDRLNLIASVPIGRLTLTSQSAFVHWRSPRQQDYDFLAANLYNSIDDERNRVFTQELRISSPSTDRFRFLAGVFYYNNDWGLDRTAIANVNTINFALTGFTTSNFFEKTVTYSSFASASFEIVEGLRITSGLRYTHEEKRATLARTGALSIGGPTSSLPPIPFTQLPDLRADPLDGDVGVEFQPTRAFLLYATYSKGSKSGGYQEAPTSVASARFTPERSYTAEFGAKLDLRARGYATVALFDTKTRDFQTTTFRLVGNPPVNQSTVGNSDVGSRGVEAAAAYRIASSLNLVGNLLYADGRFLKDFLPIGAKGDRVVRSPEWSGKFGADYQTGIGNDLVLNIQPSVEFTSSYLLQYARDRPDAPAAEAHQLYDLRASLRSQRLGVELAVIGTNLTNTKFATFSTAVSNAGSAVGQRAYYGGVNRPRVIGLQATFKR